jgi:Endonuclease-reverse transcriptase
MSYKPLRISVAQLNCNRSNAYQDTLFQLAIDHKIDLLLIQEPYLRPDGEPHLHRAFTTLRPDLSPDLRVVAYVLNSSTAFKFTTRPDIIKSPYILPIEVLTPDKEKFIIYNVYNRKLPGSQYPVDYTDISVTAFPYTIIAGDLNAKSPYWDPRLRTSTTNARKIEAWIDGGATLHNTPEDLTFYRRRDNGDIYRACLDLTLSFSPGGGNDYELTNWCIDEEAATGSDHSTIRFTIECSAQASLPPPPPIQRWRWDAWKSLPPPPEGEPDERNPWDDWEADFKRATTGLALPDIHTTPDDLDELADQLERILVETTDKYFPRCRLCTMSKRWWNKEIEEKQKVKLACKRDWFHNRDDNHHQRYKAARNDFLRTIRKSKTESWNEYLGEVKGNEIWDAHRYTKPVRGAQTDALEFEGQTCSTFEDKEKAFRKTLFPPVPPGHEFKLPTQQQRDVRLQNGQRHRIPNGHFTSRASFQSAEL